MKYEHQPKIVKLTANAAILIAGDAAFQSAIIAKLKFWVGDDDTIEVGVSVLADWYQDAYVEVRNKWLWLNYLSPLGYPKNSLDPEREEGVIEFPDHITNQLQGAGPSDAHALIVGSDDNGAHIFRFSYGQLTDMDLEAVAAVGTGRYHAESHLQTNAHTPEASLEETVYKVFSAKRRSEIAPGVGAATDMMLFGYRGSLELEDTVVDVMGSAYEDQVLAESVAATEASAPIKAYLAEFFRPPDPEPDPDEDEDSALDVGPE